MNYREQIEQKLEDDLDPLIQKAVSEYKDEMMLQMQKGGYFNAEALNIRVETARKEIKERLMRPQERDRIERGFQILMEKSENMPEGKRIKEEMKRAKEKLPQIMPQIGGETEVQELLGISNETLTVFYTISCNLHESKNFEEAAAALMYLTNLNTRLFEPHLLLGYVLQSLEEYESALQSFYTASTLEPYHPEPYFRMAECYLSLGEKDKADELFTVMERELSNRDNFNPYREKIKKLKRF